jgi:hypothetical protein
MSCAYDKDKKHSLHGNYNKVALQARIAKGRKERVDWSHPAHNPPEDGTDYFSSLAQEILALVFSNLQVASDFGSLCMVCKTWEQVGSQVRFDLLLGLT